MDHINLERAIRDHRVHDVLDSLWVGALRGIVRGESSFRAVRHPLGFTCLPLSRASHAVGVCVHVWSATDRATRTTSSVHCHSWDLLSFVLQGRIDNELYDVTDGADGEFRVYEIRTQDGRDEMVVTDRIVDSTLKDIETRTGGQLYELPAGHFHASSMKDVDTVTVVMGWRRHGARDLSLGHPDVVPTVKVREQFGEEETATIVRDLLERLSVGVALL